MDMRRRNNTKTNLKHDGDQCGFLYKGVLKQSRVGDAEHWTMTRKQTKNMPRAPHAKLLNQVLPMRALEHGIQRRTVTPSELHLA